MNLNNWLTVAGLAFTAWGCGSSGGSGSTSIAAPTATFTLTPVAPIAGQAVSFTDTSTGSPSRWSWSFGDGGTSTVQSPTHTYATAGSYTATLTATNGGGSGVISRTVTIAAAPAPPTAAFTFSPSTPTPGQAITFTDTSTGSPTSWAWSFGDGQTSTLQHPTHAFAAAGAYTVSLTATSAGGASAPITHGLTVAAGGTAIPFDGNVILGSPTATGIKASLFSPTQGGTAYLQVGTAPGTYTTQSASVTLSPNAPAVITLTGLAANTRHYYRLAFKEAAASQVAFGAECSFQTARSAASTFSFTLQADSHLDGNCSLDVYLKTLANIAAEGPDFHIDLGDTFMCEKFSAPLTNVSQTSPDNATVVARYQYERPHFGVIGATVPLFLTNGNHEGESGWMHTSEAGEDLAVWATLARERYYLNPAPDGFYQGDPTDTPFVGQRAAYYAWTWGSALFVVLDPYWNSVKPGSSGWNLTLGKAQYDWLTSTLAGSSAPFKFVFIHNLVGGLDGQMRGGAEAAPYFEWGGGDNSTTPSTFAQMRPGWALPIHDLLVRHKVTAVFHGHDHLYCKQDLDGIVYQEVPQPSASNSQSGPNLAQTYHYASGTILSSSGHLRVTVAPDKVTAQYVRTWLPSQENATQRNGSVDDTWTVNRP